MMATALDRRVDERPAPFAGQEHEFGSLQEACVWLGDAVIQGGGAGVRLKKQES